MKSYKVFIGFAALFGFLAVVIGAFGTHALEKGLSTEAIQRIDTGLKYQVSHIAALLSVGVLASLHRNFDSTSLKISGLAFILGILLFSGSLYTYAITGNELFGKITPFGGLSFLLGWLFLLFFSFKK